VTYFNPSTTGNQPSKTIIPETLQATVDSIAGRRASQLAVLLAFILVMAGFIVAGFIISSAIKSAMAATARQPLAKQAIFQRMFQSCALALGIVAASMVSALVVVRIL
jgi:F0F1-type ATP synthase membrane subunit c/vacuolar-type H+-ATPase subunit K